MVDVHDESTRSKNMRAIRSGNTKPELVVRKYLHRAGLRYSLHRKDLPGTPDIVLPRWSAVVFVHGCYWHRHEGCRYSTTPKSNAEFWERKFTQNVERDKRNRIALEKLGWRVFTVWGCQTDMHKYLESLVCSVREVD